MSIEMKISLTVVFCYFMLLADSFSMIMSFNSIIILLYIMWLQFQHYDYKLLSKFNTHIPVLRVHFLTDFNLLSQIPWSHTSHSILGGINCTVKINVYPYCCRTAELSYTYYTNTNRALTIESKKCILK